MKTKPGIIKEIEQILGGKHTLNLPKNTADPLRGVMGYQPDYPKYALDGEGRLIGLNLAGVGLDDGKWGRIAEKLTAEAKFLQALILTGNKLTNLFLPKGLKTLKILDISENKLKEFSLPSDAEALQELYLHNNPLTSPPPEIVQQGGKAVLSWFASFKKDENKGPFFLKEIKVLLVGEGLAGKTSVLKKIKGLPFLDNESQTHGVNVEIVEMGKTGMFQKFPGVSDVKMRIWDFGGQEIMHATHQFFLTHRSIYIFVLDSRTDNKKDYWLRHIQKFGGGSPAIVAINKMDENKSYSLEESTLNKKYPFVDNRFIKMSCKTEWNLNQFAQTLAELIPETPLFKTPISESWLNIKNQLELETAQNHYINRDRFLEICKQHKEDDPNAQKTLLRYLNALGVILHFPSLKLQSFFVLDPHWVTIGVYKIINSPSITDGILHEKDLDYILNTEDQKKEEYDPSKEKKIHYSDQEQLYLVSIMKEFELLYEYKPRKYLIPDLLPKEVSTPVAFDQKEAVEFIMEYDFLPPNVISQFIIHMKDDIRDLGNLWRTGVLLSNKKFNCTALVTADLDRGRLTIAINGQEHRKREYFSIILHRLYAINEGFADLKITEKMPVPGHPEIEWDYEDLLGLEKMGKDELTIGRIGKTFSVSRDFLDKISTKKDRQIERKTGLNINIQVDDRATRESFARLERGMDGIEKNTLSILHNQNEQQKYLDSLLKYAERHQEDIRTTITLIESSKDSETELERVNDILEEQLGKFFAQLPTSSEIVQKWKEANTKLPHQPDAKWKLKFKIPFLFGEFEKELSWDLKAALRMMRKEFNALRKGEKTIKQLFIEEDED